MDIKPLILRTIEKKASDLHLVTDLPPVLRINGELFPFPNVPPLKGEDAESLIFSILTPEQKDLLLANREIDFSVTFSSVRFRVNAYFQKGTLAAALRLIPSKIPTIEELNLPEICHSFPKVQQGFVLIVGPAGHGKSTTVASIMSPGFKLPYSSDSL